VIWQSRPLFVSSTFADMQAERDHLRTHIFPALEERLNARRGHLEWVDLRVGVATAGETRGEVRELQVLKVCLAEVRRCRPFLIVLLGDRYGWVPPLERLTAAAGEEGFAGGVTGRSVTDLEIRFGALADPEQQPRSFFYFREPLPYQDMPREIAALYSDAHDDRPDAADGARKLAELKEEIVRALPQRVRRYSVRWDEARQRITGLEAWGQMVLEDIWSDLEAATAAGEEDTPSSWQEAERLALDDYIEDRARDFIGRDAVLARLQGVAESPAQKGVPWGVVLTGAAGAGKSAIFGELHRRLERAGTFVLAHAAGASARSPSVEDMLRRWIDVLAAGLGATADLAENADPETIEATFRTLLGRMAAERRLVVLIDALDQFEAATRARYMTWLPHFWPDNARLIATAIPGDASNALAERAGVELLPLPPLDENEARRIAERICLRYHRTLEPEVLNALLSKQDAQRPAWGNTLWLTLAVEELNLVDADDFSRAKTYSGAAAEQLRALLIDKIAAFAPDVLGLYGASFDRAYELFGASLARAFLALIALSRSGWRETDLRALLPRVSGESWDELRFASLRRLFRGQLRQRGALNQWTVAHDQMRAAMQQRLVAEAVGEAPIHADIANHLLSLTPDDPLRESEVMWHLLGSEDWQRTTAYYGAASLTRVQLESATREFARAFDKATAQGQLVKSELIVDSLQRALLGRHPESQLTLSRLNAWLTYMQPALLRKALTRGAQLESAFDELEGAAKDFAIRCRSRLGEHWRRDGKLNEAWALLRPLAGPIRQHGFMRRVANPTLGWIRRCVRSGGLGRDLSDHAPVYELGYIEFLRGNLAAARKLFEHSANLETAFGNQISASISRCVAGNCGFIAELSIAALMSSPKPKRPEAQAFRRILLKARRTFAKAAADPVAERWMWNVSAHLFEIAFSLRERDRGQVHFAEMMRSDWARRFDQTHLTYPHQARYEMLAQRWEAAVDQFRRYFESIELGPRNYREALARSALDYGDALVKSERPDDAAEIWRVAMTLPGDAGNRPWQSIIQRRLADADQ
jgi:hypothetical protein